MGDKDGLAVGDGDGASVGDAVGAAVGTEVGEAVGEDVGDGVGVLVGTSVGLAVWFTHSAMPWSGASFPTEHVTQYASEERVAMLPFGPYRPAAHFSQYC